MEAKKQLRQLTPYKPGKPIEEVKREFGLEKIVKLASNENPYGCSATVKDAILSEVNQLALYPDGYSAELREALSQFLHVSKDQLIFGNGSDEIVQILSRSYLGEGSNTIMATPTFPQYKHNAIIEGAEVIEVPLVAGEHDLEAMLQAINEQTKIVWLCSPNNPTGNHITESAFAAFMKRVPKHVLVVSDEAYYEYVEAEDYPETVPYLQQYPNLVILRTFSKAYGLAALRVGYGIASEEIISGIEPAREPFNTSRIAQKAALAALQDQDFIKACFTKNRDGIQQYYDFCEAHGLYCFPSQANFVFIDVEQNSDELFNYLLERGYIVRAGTALGYPNAVRITVGSAEQNEAILTHIAAFLASRTTV
ncbi:histidinol-phosphate aminotransferase [Fictibacillus macauensis ZFHKF-1]|uniref:Histidinol-phosphate aminotransferase n=1 Tax=Fictibacillus macauensis ZFHKF-1 TaxID=1196324 RepID=I8UIF1_9BACL|nr:histidinol-phosphate transaminase [Fictibacillus macauensis]EIT86598.1 histidinol-phosphate aminotransferase [Fictibacillus macauensis ZFHKF-1]